MLHLSGKHVDKAETVNTPILICEKHLRVKTGQVVHKDTAFHTFAYGVTESTGAVQPLVGSVIHLIIV